MVVQLEAIAAALQEIVTLVPQVTTLLTDFSLFLATI